MSSIKNAAVKVEQLKQAHAEIETERKSLERKIVKAQKKVALLRSQAEAAWVEANNAAEELVETLAQSQI